MTRRRSPWAKKRPRPPGRRLGRPRAAPRAAMSHPAEAQAFVAALAAGETPVVACRAHEGRENVCGA